VVTSRQCLDQPQPHRCGQCVALLIAWTIDFHLAEPQFHDSGTFGALRLARRKLDLPSSCHGKARRRIEQRAAADQPAVHHGPRQQMQAGLRQGGPVGVDVSLTVGDHRYHRGRLQHRLRSLRRCQPAMRFTLRKWAIPMVLSHHAGPGPDLAPHQSKAGGGGSVHRDPPPSR